MADTKQTKSIGEHWAASELARRGWAPAFTRDGLARTDILARSLPNVTCPVHAIYGANDSLYKAWIAALQEAYAKAVPDFRGLELIPQSGHWVQFESPEAFKQALFAALKDGEKA